MFPFLGVYLWHPFSSCPSLYNSCPQSFIITIFTPPVLTFLLKTEHKVHGTKQTPPPEALTGTSLNISRCERMFYQTFPSSRSVIFFSQLDPVLTPPCLPRWKPTSDSWVNLIPPSNLHQSINGLIQSHFLAQLFTLCQPSCCPHCKSFLNGCPILSELTPPGVYFQFLRKSLPFFPKYFSFGVFSWLTFSIISS